MKKLAVFCGSKDGASPLFKEAAATLGTVLAQQDYGLVYGGSRVGTMGAVADAILAANGQAIGVLPHFLQEKEIAHPNLTELHLVESMHDRKAKMAELADGFIILPGGPGTMEEFFEVFTWAQLGLHEKPCGILNIDGYYDPLIALFKQMETQGFIIPEHAAMLLVESTPEALLERFRQYEAPHVKSYLNTDQT
ncbi:MAG: TIGR00730 family Rossman fold protein [Exiguobacterium oxidotolerans]|uniref:Cytokinin riboside 5'-monophosphate phosphoribohydrolase n=1 Tax=Exiguobacterium oxidotolerans TaxID=223958 RepID=A0A653I7M8_9BACL|nr:TIGR00730 family Rossman fold protein [Exiguobacterium oxidotolerans]VWX34865.1 putative cytokinin riboside 5'-monophosphate phosphoribohydrolase [Exiguobacterium oxidotolerans]